MEFLKVWFAGLMNMYGNPARESQRLEAAKQSTSKLRTLKNFSPADEDEDGEKQRSVMDKGREGTQFYPTPTRSEITHHRLEALSAKLAERQA